MMRYILPCWTVGVVISFMLPFVPSLWMWLVLFCMLLVAVRRWPWFWLVCVGIIGLAYGVYRTEWALERQWPVGGVQDSTLTIEIDDLPNVNERRIQFVARAWDQDGHEYRLLLSDYQLRDWPLGSRWKTSARVRPIIGEVNLRGLNREALALANGLDGAGTLGKQRILLAENTGWGISVWRHSISQNWQHIQEHYPQFSDGIGLIRALSIGEQSALRPALWQIFRPLGLTHLVSISGLHVTMVAMLFGLLMWYLLRFLPWLPAKPRLWVLSVGMAGALFYAVLAGFSVPTQRSVLMLAAFAVMWWHGRSASSWSSWFQALALVLLWNPLAVLAVGTWLSFGLVGGLIWAATGRLNEGKWMVAARGQWAATVFSVVLLGYIFASLPLFSPLVNLLAIPWFSWILTPLALLGSVIHFWPLQWLAAALAEYTLHFLVWLADFSPEFAVAAAPWVLMLLALLAALIVLLPRGLGLYPWASLVLLGFVSYQLEAVDNGHLKVVVMDAGQGLSVLLQTHGHNLLFDTGTAQAAATGIVPSMNALGVRHLDALILSHHDTDHDGGFAGVRHMVKVDTLWAGQPEFYSKAQLCSEQRWQWDGVHFELLRPSEDVEGDDNDKSCVLRVVAGDQAILMTGDLGKKGELALVEKYDGALSSQILVLGHHGSSTASSGIFLNAVSPQYAVASSGYGNSYKHPTVAVQNRVRAHGATLLRTDLSGAWVFQLGNQEQVISRMTEHKFYWQKKPFE